jgi:hypothetical protein
MGDPYTSVSEVKCLMVEKIIKSIFTPNKQRLFLTFEQEVMVILVDGAEADARVHGIKNKTPQFLHKYILSYAGCFMTSHQTWRLLTTINISCIPHL